MKANNFFSAITAVCFLILFSLSTAHAQDTIVKKNGDIIRAKITEIGIEEVKFKVFGETDGPVITLKKSEIKTAKVGGQTIIDTQADVENSTADIIIKKTGELLKVKVLDIGVEEVKFKLFSDPDGPTINIAKSDIRTMKVAGQTVIDVKAGLGEDIITKKDGTTIKAKISEIGTEDVKFKLFNNPDGPTMSLKKKEIDNIKVDGQSVYEYKEDPMSISNHAILDKTSTIKFYFFSPLKDHIAFGYEWMLKPGFNWDIGAGIIGPGTSLTLINERNAKGGFIRFGPKFLLGSASDIEVEGARYAHPLKGRYFKVEMILNSSAVTYFQDTSNIYSGSQLVATHKDKYQSMTIDLGYGRQFIFGNTITVSYYFGVGYSFENKSTTIINKFNNWWGTVDELDWQRYSHRYFGTNFPLATTVRVTVGYILRTPDWLSGKKGYSKPPTRHSMDK